MVEIILAYSLLVDVGLLNASEYENSFNKLFLKTPNSDFLSELAWCFSDMKKVKTLVFDYCEKNELDYDVFGSILMEKLSLAYFQENVDIHTFNSKLLEIWGGLPKKLMQIEPFWTMSYAGEPLLWGDIKQTRKLYNNMFDFYGKNKN